MIETNLYVGLNDATTKHQEHDTKEYVDVMKYVCKSYHVPFSFIISEGGYFHENGDYTQEKTLILSLIDADKEVADAIAKDLCTFFHQESVLMTEREVKAYHVKDGLGI